MDKLNPFKPKRPARPYLKVCTKCHGKGQLSKFNTAQQKTYGSCDKCTEGNDITGLGVTLKCDCQEHSAPYKFIRATELKYTKGLERYEVENLKRLQAELERTTGGTAILLQCDCGARYMTKDTAVRKRISGAEGQNEEDKEFNKEIAAALAQTGIVHVLKAAYKPY